MDLVSLRVLYEWVRQVPGIAMGLAVLLLAAAVPVGCQPARPMNVGPMVAARPALTGGRPAVPVAVPPVGSVRIDDLAQHLGLKIVGDTGNLVSLSNARNMISVFPDPGGQAYVNGMPVGPRGGIVRIQGVVYVPAIVEASIRSSLALAGTGVTPAAPRRRHRIVIDPGHGGKDPGTISSSGVYEKTITLAVATQLARRLSREGYDVVLTRSTDVYVDLDERAEISNRAGAELFVSIHADSSPDATLRGATIYTCRDAPSRSTLDARRMQESLDRGGVDCRGMREANYRVLVGTTCPAMLIELGYLSNATEARELSSPAIQQQLADAIAAGIQRCFEP